jgi:hypothetical protein
LEVSGTIGTGDQDNIKTGDGSLEKIPDEIKIKIMGKMLGMVYVRSLEDLNPRITVPEFKFIIGSFRIKKGNWYAIAKEFENEKFIKLYKNFKGMEVLRHKTFVKS